MVLILILLEYGLRPTIVRAKIDTNGSLNPYSIGIWSATFSTDIKSSRDCFVLILILLEYGLRPKTEPRVAQGWRRS